MRATDDRLSFLRPFVLLSCLGIVVCILYFAQGVLIPLALAVLLTFLLAPPVMALQRRGLPRVPAVIVVVIAAFVLFSGIAWLVVGQATSLVDSLPDYEKNLHEKIDSILAMSESGFVQRIEGVLERIKRRIERPGKEESGRTGESSATDPLPVRVVDDAGPFNLTDLWALAAPLLAPFAAAGVVIVLVIFLLIRREDMRDRMISLIGRGRLTLTTKALDDAGQRISRYLLAQLVVNGTFGVAVALGLYFIGVPYALLWGFLAAVLRYVPYLGPWLAAAFPLALAILITPGWTTPLLVVGLFLVLETASNLFMEPWLYGRNVGVSDAASIVAIAFWTWLWGPVGLILAYPLTVCLAVLGRHVPFLKFLDTLLSDRPALEPHVGFYQRLLARDEDEALDIAEERLAESSPASVYDELLVPALNFAQRDLVGDLVTDDEHQAMLNAVTEIANDLAEQYRAKTPASDETTERSDSTRVMILACPARDETDEVSLRLLENSMDHDKYDLHLTKSSLLANELAALVEEKQPKLVGIAALPPGGLAHARYLCKRLRACSPELKIVVGRWGLKGSLEKNRDQLQAAGADYVAFTLAETHQQILALLPVLAAPQPQPPVPTESPLSIATQPA